MKVIYPILITAVWACATIEIKGVWSPAISKQSLVEVAEKFEAPSPALLARLHHGMIQDASPKPVADSRLKQIKKKARQFALPTVSTSPQRPVCS